MRRIFLISFIAASFALMSLPIFSEGDADKGEHAKGEETIDLDKEKARLQKEIDQVNNFIKGLTKKLDNKEFVKNAPKEVVQKEEIKLKDQKDKLAKLEEQLKNLK